MVKASKSLQKSKDRKIRIENWIIEAVKPERRHKTTGFRAMAAGIDKAVLKGIIYNHPDYDDGEEVEIYDIVNYDYNLRVARTGSYEIKLGQPTKDYVKWLHQNGYVY